MSNVDEMYCEIVEAMGVTSEIWGATYELKSTSSNSVVCEIDGEYN